VNIGGALAEARSEAGLTVTQVSERTRIRETIIHAIERDDYSACGGDFYTRGHIRAIARVVGADPVPLIEEYDGSRLPPPEPAAAGPAWPGVMDPAYSPPGITAAEAFRPGLPMDFERRRPWSVRLVMLVLVLIGVVVYLLVSHG